MSLPWPEPDHIVPKVDKLPARPSFLGQRNALEVNAWRKHSPDNSAAAVIIGDDKDAIAPIVCRRPLNKQFDFKWVPRTPHIHNPLSLKTAERVGTGYATQVKRKTALPLTWLVTVPLLPSVALVRRAVMA